MDIRFSREPAPRTPVSLVTLELSRGEAAALYAICGYISGHDNESYRGLFAEIYWELDDALSVNDKAEALRLVAGSAVIQFSDGHIT